jgi:hypothetical protein
MNDKRDFDRAVDRWLDDGSDATPPEVIDAVLLAVKSTPQERDVRILRRISPMTMYLRAAAVFVTIAVAGVAALYAFGSGPNVGSVPTPDPTQPTLTQQPTASTGNPDEPLGVFDLEAFEGRFDVELSAQTLSESSNVQYAAVDEVGLNFIVDADDPNNAIVGTGITSRLPDHNAATVDEWLAFVAETQPDAAEWLTTERDNYLVAPGAEVSIAKWFGGLCAWLVTSSPILEPGSDVNSLSMSVQYEEDCP